MRAGAAARKRHFAGSGPAQVSSQLQGASTPRENTAKGAEEGAGGRAAREAEEWGKVRKEATAAPPETRKVNAASRPPAQSRGCGGGG